MLIYDDIYTWEGPAHGDQALWIMTCHLWIIDLSLSHPEIVFIRPTIVVASDISDGPRRKICAETLGRQIYLDFHLDIRRTLWVEYDPSLPAKMTVAYMKPRYHDGQEMIYSIQWRNPMNTEKDMIRRFIPKLDI
ncbi:MAG: hypothetical protein KKD44_09975 [Proteobacteria bacterium]|nr:hypothetical protein [Pseudomonadota bacterium]